MIKCLRKLIHKNEIADLLIESYDFRTVVFSAFSFIGNVAYAIFNIVVYGLTDSLWCGAMALYHIMLVVLRGYVLFAYYKGRKTSTKSEEEKILLEIKRYRFCGIVFISLTLCLSAMIMHIVRADKVFDYEIYVIYTVAGFTLYQIVISIVNYIKVQSSDSYAVRSLRCINLTTALVSLISLQAIALDTFSHHVNIPFGNALTGFIVCGLIVANGVSIIVKSTTMIRKIKQTQSQNSN